MKREKLGAPPIVGGSSLLVIFVVLCLTVFALLSISTVQADRRLSDATADAIAGYYAADAEAEAILAQLRSTGSAPGVHSENDIYTYACPASDTQALAVTLRRLQNNHFSVLQWQLVATESWSPDGSIQVWTGDEEE